MKAIAAMSENRVIGDGNKIPWRLPEDFKWFKKMTTGHIIVMGRKTFESIGKPLPNRETIVLSRAQFSYPGVRTISDLSQLNASPDGREIFICGGAQIYAQALPLCSDLYLTHVKRTVAGDAFFPAFEDQFEPVEQIMDCPEFKIVHYKNHRIAQDDRSRDAIAKLNALTQDEFVRIVGPVFEHSPWIAAEAWAKRPFADVDRLHRVMTQIVANADEAKQVELIRAHPDLVGRAALAGTLTAESNREQASAGLDRLSPDEIATFQKYNQAYREKFDFPFVICARLNKKEAILKGFETRLHNTREQEIKTALEEIGKIARLRLDDLAASLILTNS